MPLTAPLPSTVAKAVPCLVEGGGYLRARISGAIQAELNWENADTECKGGIRPSGGARLSFGHAFGKHERLVLVFGIPGMQEAKDGRDLPVNVTVIHEGTGQFFGTLGDDKCTITSLRQETLAGIPLRNRSYRVTASGFCMAPARAVAGNGSVLITRFDFAGRAEFLHEESEPTPPAPAQTVAKTK